MLPSYGGGYGSKRRSGGSSASLIVPVILAAGLIFAGWGIWSLRSQAEELQDRFDRLKSNNDLCQTQAINTRTSHQHIDYQIRNTEQRLTEAQRLIRSKDQDLLQKETECQGKLDEMEDRMAFEKEVNTALQKHMQTLDEAHKNREVDWHDLYLQWKKYEEGAIAENHRLLQEIAELKNLSKPVTFDDSALPYEEPKYRPETKFNADFHKPEYHPSDLYIKHLQQPLVPEGQQGEQMLQQGSGSGDPSNEAALEQIRRSHREAEEAYRNQHNVLYPQLGQQHGAADANAPDVHHPTEVLNYQYEENWNEEQNPLDPMDHYWTHDGFDEGHDNYHGVKQHNPGAHPPNQHDSYRGHDYDDWHNSGAHHYEDHHNPGDQALGGHGTQQPAQSDGHGAVHDGNRHDSTAGAGGGQATARPNPNVQGDYYYDHSAKKWVFNPQEAARMVLEHH